MRLKLLLSLFCLTLFTSSALAQQPTIPPPTTQPVQSGNKYDFPQFFKETGAFFTQPARWALDDWLTAGFVGATTVLATQADQPVRDVVQKNSGKYFYSAPIVFGRIMGELYTPVALFGGFATYSLITGDVKARKIAYELGQASLYGGAFVFLTKILVGRSRPFVNEGYAHFRPSFSIVDDPYHSFPSGHTTISFLIATVLSRNVEPLWAKVLLYVPAVLTATSRVYQDQHWTSDVIMGSAIGYFFGKWVVDQHEANDDAAAGTKDKSGLQITSFVPFTVSLALK